MKAGWTTTKLMDQCSVITKGTTPTSIGHKFTTSGPNFIKIESITQAGTFITSKFANISFDAHEALKRSQLKQGDILFSIAGALGRTAIVDATILPANTNQALAIIRLTDEPHFYKEYLRYFFTSELMIEQIEKLKGGAAQQNLSLTQLKELQIPLPPLEEQKRIVSILDEAFEGLDRARENAEANLKNARELFDNQLENELSVLAQSSQCLLDEHVDLLSGFAFKSKAYSEDTKDMRLMRGDNIIPGKVRWEQAKYWPNSDIEKYERYMLNADDLLIAMDRTWIKSGIKYAVLKSEDVPCLLVQRVARLRSKSTISHAFLELLISSKAFEQYVIKIQTGLGVPHISSQQIKDFPAKVPSSQKQHEITSKMQSIRASSESLEADYTTKLQDISDLRQSLLQKAFAGELT